MNGPTLSSSPTQSSSMSNPPFSSPIDLHGSSITNCGTMAQSFRMPIFFVQNDRRTLGLQLVHAATGDCMGLLNARDGAPVGNCHHIAMRIKVGGSTSRKDGHRTGIE
jgi:hypothetical protein